MSKNDAMLEIVISNLPNFKQVQYSTNEQLQYLKDIANRLGLYDGADAIQRRRIFDE